MARIASLRRWLVPVRWTIFDLTLAMALLLITLQQRVQVPLDWWICAVPMVVAIVVRRRWPVTAVLLAVVGTVQHHLGPARDFEVLDLAVPLTLYTLASSDRARRVSMSILAGALACATLLSVVDGFRWAAAPIVEAETVEQPADQAAKLAELERRGIEGLWFIKPGAGEAQRVSDGSASVGDLLASAAWQAVGLLLVLGFAFAVGDGVRSRRAYLRSLEIRAADLEREQDQRIALATAAERARITRELHDVVAHGLSVIVVQAQGGAAALGRHPDRTAAALQSVITTGRASLAEMRRLLDIVRRDPASLRAGSGSQPASLRAGPGSEPSEGARVDGARLDPQPGIGALPELIDRVRSAGTPVTFSIAGDPVPLPVTVDLSAYRIAQEALTNTIKHAGPNARATVDVRFQADAVEVEVTDDGTGGPEHPAEGGGLRGIAERVAALGGDLTIGPLAGGGFRVRAVLPLPAMGNDG